MFEDSLFATNHRRSPQQRWAALTSFALQAALVTVLVGLPLFFTEALPVDYVRSFIELPEPPPGRVPAPAETAARSRSTNSNLNQQGQVIAVRQIPRTVTRLNDRDVAPPRIGPGGGVLGLPQG